MCDVCSTDPKWHTPPNTDERHAEVQVALEDKIMQNGHQVMAIYGDEAPGFFYTVGRYMIGKPELLLTGSLAPPAGMEILNAIAELEDTGQVDLTALATDAPVRLPGFDSELRLIPCDPIAADMTVAVSMGGTNLPAIQVIWPGPHGDWPDSGRGWHYGDGSEQPIFRARA